MGIRITATESARLVGVSERTMRDWLTNGKPYGKQRHKLSEEQATKLNTKGPVSWSIDVEALEGLPGVHVDPERLTELQAERSKSPGTLRVRIEALERQVRDLQREITRIRVSALTRGVSSYEPESPPVTRYDDQESLSELAPLSEYPQSTSFAATETPPAPSVSPRSVSVATHLHTGGVSAGDELLGPFAKRHGMPPRTAQDYADKGKIAGERRQSPNRPSEKPWWLSIEQQRAALAHWQATWGTATGHRLFSCADPLCVCHEVLTS